MRNSGERQQLPKICIKPKNVQIGKMAFSYLSNTILFKVESTLLVMSSHSIELDVQGFFVINYGALFRVWIAFWFPAWLQRLPTLQSTLFLMICRFWMAFWLIWSISFNFHQNIACEIKWIYARAIGFEDYHETVSLRLLSENYELIRIMCRRKLMIYNTLKFSVQ